MGGLGGLLGRLEAKLRAKMAPSWVPRGRFLGSRNEAKMVALLGASCGRYFYDFSSILVDIWKAKWSQVGIKLEFNKERAWKRVFLTNLRFP